jgi:hypothetical protein
MANNASRKVAREYADKAKFEIDKRKREQISEAGGCDELARMMDRVSI